MRSLLASGLPAPKEASSNTLFALPALAEAALCTACEEDSYHQHSPAPWEAAGLPLVDRGLHRLPPPPRSSCPFEKTNPAC